MKRRPFQMSLRQKIWLYGSFALTVLSGSVWAVLWHFYREEPDMAMPFENRLMKFHLAGALILLVAVGAALPQHSSKSWAAGINRLAGALFGLSLGIATLSAYGILAFVWDTQWVHFTHIGAGAAMLILLAVHIFTGRWAEKKRIEKKTRNTATSSS